MGYRIRFEKVTPKKEQRLREIETDLLSVRRLVDDVWKMVRNRPNHSNDIHFVHENYIRLQKIVHSQADVIEQMRERLDKLEAEANTCQMNR